MPYIMAERIRQEVRPWVASLSNRTGPEAAGDGSRDAQPELNLLVVVEDEKVSVVVRHRTVAGVREALAKELEVSGSACSGVLAGSSSLAQRLTVCSASG